MKRLLENLIREWRQRPLPNILPREINLKKYINIGEGVNKIITVVGFRRTGKTYALLELAQKIGRENCVYLNLEDERLPRETKILTLFLETLTEIYQDKPYFLLLDEVQNIPNWNLWARRVNETTNHRLFLSGSSSKLSSAELPTELRGRSLTVKIEPLNFREFLKFRKVPFKELPRPQKLFWLREYLSYGGFPETVLAEEGKKPLILDEYYQTFIRRDIVDRYRLRNDTAMKALVPFLLNSSYITIARTERNLKTAGLAVSKPTVMRYLNYLQQSFFLTEILLHTPSLKNRLAAEKKPLFVDNFFLSRYATSFTQNTGRLMENMVGQKIIHDLTTEEEVYYWKDYQGREVDYAVRRQETTKGLFQVSFVSRQEEIAEREIKALTKAAEQLKTENLKLITWDYEGEITTGSHTINCQPLDRFLLEKCLDQS
ncbi:MAG: ATP-binding protein [bacterium]|nr:ATP-binding protein [bacterium]